MAGRAHVVRVSVTRREWGVLRVIESRTCPGSRVMAVLAGSWEELGLRRVARIGAVVVVGLMAADTGGRQRRVIAVDVAVRTLPRWNQVRPGQRECSVVVVEGGVRPYHCVMAQLAGSWKSRRRVRRIVCPGVILLMTRVAQSAGQVVVVVDVAIRALPRRYRVRSSQRKPRSRMVELAIRP